MVMSQDKVKVKITIGKANVEIEASPELLEKAIKNVISALGVSQQEDLTQEQVPQKPYKPPEGHTCRTLIESIIDEGWFSTPRTLSEVVEELARRGHHYDATAVSHVLLDLVREGMLVRRGRPRRYVYTLPEALKKEESSEEALDPVL